MKFNLKLFIFILLLLAVLLGGFFIVKNKLKTNIIEEEKVNSENIDLNNVVKETPTVKVDNSKADNPSSEETNVKEFSVEMSQFQYTPNVFEVNVGDKVIIHATAMDVSHGFAVPDFDFNIISRPQETVTGSFIADKAGTYIIRCSVYCGIGHNDMSATLIVN